MARFIAPGAVLGVMGGGQLGRMFVQSAQRLGFHTVVLDPDTHSPAGLIAHRHIAAAYTDSQALAEMAEACAAITLEFENIPLQAMSTLSALTPNLSPSVEALAICQDRVREKQLFGQCGLACVAHAAIQDEASMLALRKRPELFPAILKTASMGYDGRGQIKVADFAELGPAWQALGQTACLLEQRVQLVAELSVILARNHLGEIVTLPVQQNFHQSGILLWTQVPALLPAAIQTQALAAAKTLAQALQYVGVLCVEFFLDSEGQLLVNEMAPRPHNSGHYSMDACDHSQFELQARALVDWPLVAPSLLCPCVMLNLLGDIWPAVGEPDWERVVNRPGVHLHLYGKKQARKGRKMGHLTILAPTLAEAQSTARDISLQLGIDLQGSLSTHSNHPVKA